MQTRSTARRRLGDDAPPAAAATTDASPSTNEIDAFMGSGAGGPTLGSGWDRIVTTTYRIDPVVLHERVKAGIRPIGAERAEYPELVKALDEASSIADDASLLAVNGRLVLRQYEADLEALQADMRAQATAKLQSEKESGSRSKAITDADVVGKMAAMFPDEYRRQTAALEKAKGTVKHLDQLQERAVERVRALDGMVRSSRKV